MKTWKLVLLGLAVLIAAGLMNSYELSLDLMPR